MWKGEITRSRGILKSWLKSFIYNNFDNYLIKMYYISFSFSFITHSVKSYWFYTKGVERNCYIYTYGKCKHSPKRAHYTFVNQLLQALCIHKYSSSNPWYGYPVEKSMQRRQLYAPERYIRAIKLSSCNRVYSNFIFTAQRHKNMRKRIIIFINLQCDDKYTNKLALFAIFVPWIRERC